MPWVKLRHTSESPVLLGVEISLLDELFSSLEGLSSQVLFSLREKVAKLCKLSLLDAHEDVLLRDHILEVSIRTELLFQTQSFDSDIGFQRFEDLVIAEEAVCRQVQNGQIFDALVVVVIEDLNDTLSDEIQVFDVGLVGDYMLTVGVEPAEHVDN